MDPTIWSVASSFTVWHVQDDIYVELPPIRPKNNAELFTFNGYRNNMLISYIVSREREREKNCVPGDITYQIKDTPWPFRFKIPIFRYQSHPKVVLDFYECLNKKNPIKNLWLRKVVIGDEREKRMVRFENAKVMTPSATRKNARSP